MRLVIRGDDRNHHRPSSSFHPHIKMLTCLVAIIIILLNVVFMKIHFVPDLTATSRDILKSYVKTSPESIPFYDYHPPPPPLPSSSSSSSSSPLPRSPSPAPSPSSSLTPIQQLIQQQQERQRQQKETQQHRPLKEPQGARRKGESQPSSSSPSPPPSSPGLLSVGFAALGDWGVANAGQAQVAASLAEGIRTHGNIAAILSTGDMLYPRGVTSRNDSAFQAIFEQRYTHASFDRPWLMALGNHDAYGEIEPILEYARQHAYVGDDKINAETGAAGGADGAGDGLSYVNGSHQGFRGNTTRTNTNANVNFNAMQYSPSAAVGKKRWVMPARYFYQDYPLRTGKGVHTLSASSSSSPSLSPSPSPSTPSTPSSPPMKFARVIVLDTNSLVCDLPEPTTAYEGRDCVRMSRSLHQTDGGKTRDKQLQWLSSLLRASENDAAIVTNIIIGHHPMYSVGRHGSYPLLARLLEPLIEDRRTRMYISSHDHSMQHLTISRNRGDHRQGNDESSERGRNRADDDDRYHNTPYANAKNINAPSSRPPPPSPPSLSPPSPSSSPPSSPSPSPPLSAPALHHFVNGGGGGHLHPFKHQKQKLAELPDSVHVQYKQTSFGYMIIDVQWREREKEDDNADKASDVSDRSVYRALDGYTSTLNRGEDSGADNASRNTHSDRAEETESGDVMIKCTFFDGDGNRVYTHRIEPE